MVSCPLQSQACTLDMACFVHHIHPETSRELHRFRICTVLLAQLMRGRMAQVIAAACG